MSNNQMQVTLPAVGTGMPFVSGESGKTYELRTGRDGVFYCTCPAWRYSKDHKPCKHMRAYLAGDFYQEYEKIVICG